ncbi:MAG: hypothetical protein AB7O97_01385 [Planctomycetota bacterium]
MDRTTHFPSDPRELDLDARREWSRRLQRANADWLRRLRDLAEPRVDDDFPAFLLATPPFAHLAERVGDKGQRLALPTEVADELDRFVDAYADYLRTCAGEDTFDGRTRRAG